MIVTPLTTEVCVPARPLMIKSEPVIITDVPPLVEPDVGEMLAMLGTFGVLAYTPYPVVKEVFLKSALVAEPSVEPTVYVNTSPTS